MCRIYGYAGEGSVADSRLHAAAALQVHGGPDAQTRADGEGWSLGNNRLAIVDLAGGEQPYELGDGVKAVFNGEIYNHEELRRRLTARGYRFRDRCDGSILPALYAEHGLDFVRHLDGMFAIAVVDLTGSPTVVLATDPSGVKPLYYHFDERERNLYFSSEIPALLELAGLDRAMWLPGVDAYLSTKAIFGEEHGERTMFRQVRVMPPSSLLVTKIGEKPRLSRYETLVRSELPPDDLEGAGEALAGLLGREVRSLLMADVPVATINSGGLDSSLVTTFASEAVEGIHSFNVSYAGDWPHDERRFAREVAKSCRTRHHQVEVDPRDFAGILPDTVWHLGQPNADPITLSSYALFGAVREAGFKVALSGDGADEVFGGYDRLSAAVAAPGDWARAYVDSLCAVDRSTRQRLYTEDYRAYLAENGSAVEAVERQLREAPGNRLDVMLDFEQKHRLPAYHLRRVDHLSMAHSVEVRPPFCQPRVSDFANRLAPHMKISDGRVKRVLYAAAAKQARLPASVLRRRKQPFTLPVAAMLRAGEPLYGFVSEVLVGGCGTDGILDRGAVLALLRRQGERPEPANALALWALATYELWRDGFRVGVGERAASRVGV